MTQSIMIPMGIWATRS